MDWNQKIDFINLNDPDFGFRLALRPSGFKTGLGWHSRLKIIIKSDCIFRRPGNWNVDSIRQTLDSADLIVSPGCNSSRNGSSGFSSGRDEYWVDTLFFRYPDTWISIIHIIFGYLHDFGCGVINFGYTKLYPQTRVLSLEDSSVWLKNNWV